MKNIAPSKMPLVIGAPFKSAKSSTFLAIIIPDSAPHGRGNPVSQHMKIGMFHSSDINETFTFIGSLGKGHPDPTVGFAEGQFYLLAQSGSDWVSPGPWSGTVRAWVGADSDGDGQAEVWTSWQEVQERYSQKAGYARVVEVQPASVDCSTLPASQYFVFEIEATEAEISSVELR